MKAIITAGVSIKALAAIAIVAAAVAFACGNQPAFDPATDGISDAVAVFGYYDRICETDNGNPLISINTLWRPRPGNTNQTLTTDTWPLRHIRPSDALFYPRGVAIAPVAVNATHFQFRQVWQEHGDWLMADYIESCRISPNWKPN